MKLKILFFIFLMLVLMPLAFPSDNCKKEGEKLVSAQDECCGGFYKTARGEIDKFGNRAATGYYCQKAYLGQANAKPKIYVLIILFFSMASGIISGIFFRIRYIKLLNKKLGTNYGYFWPILRLNLLFPEFYYKKYKAMQDKLIRKYIIWSIASAASFLLSCILLIFN